MIKITWLGHSTFLFKLASGETILTDPWLGNPKFPPDVKLDRIDLILVTHGHSDHTADVVDIAKTFYAPVVANHEIATWFAAKGVAETKGMNKGGSLQAGAVHVTMTHAVHSSSMMDGDQMIYGGEPAGYVIAFPDGRSL